MRQNKLKKFIYLQDVYTFIVTFYFRMFDICQKNGIEIKKKIKKTIDSLFVISFIFEFYNTDRRILLENESDITPRDVDRREII